MEIISLFFHMRNNAKQRENLHSDFSEECHFNTQEIIKGRKSYVLGNKAHLFAKKKTEKMTTAPCCNSICFHSHSINTKLHAKNGFELHFSIAGP